MKTTRDSPFRIPANASPTSSYELSYTEAKKQQQEHSIEWGKIIGFDEFLSLTAWRASVAELLGTAALVFALDAMVISTLESHTEVSNLILSCLAAIITTILHIATFPVSGGHINPMVTFAAFLYGLISVSRAIIYISAQCAGGVLGAQALKSVVNSNIERTSSLGGCTLTIIAPGPHHGPVVIGLDTSSAPMLEIICGFVFLFASVSIAFDPRQSKALGIVAVRIIMGAVLGSLVFVSTPATTMKGYAGARLNPARCLGPAIVRGGHLWNGHWVFWAGPAIYCMVFCSVFKSNSRSAFARPRLMR